jgi:hypothetical protein
MCKANGGLYTDEAIYSRLPYFEESFTHHHHQALVYPTAIFWCPLIALEKLGLALELWLELGLELEVRSRN